MRRDIWLAGVAGAIVGSWLTLIAVQFAGHGFSLPGRGGSDTMAESKPAAAAPIETTKPDPTPPKAVETPKPAETAKQDDKTPDKSQPENQEPAQVAGPAAQATPEKATPPAASPPAAATADGSPQPSATETAAATPAAGDGDAAKAPGGGSAKAEDSKAATEPAVPQDNKVPTDPARTDDASTKPAETPPAAAAATEMAKGADIPAAQTVSPTDATSDKAAAAAPTDPSSADQTKVEPAPDNRMPADQIDREIAAAEHQTLPPQAQTQAQPQPQAPVQPQAQTQPKPESQQASLDPASKPQEQTTTIELVRPFADQAGILTISGRSVQLTGVIPTDVDRMCARASGKSWPCGQAARTAFRMYLRGRSIDCDVPDANWKGTVKGACRYVRVDLSTWLVRFGWADPEPGSPLSAFVDEAKQKKRGMYGDDPRKNGKSTLAPPPAKEDPLNPI